MSHGASVCHEKAHTRGREMKYVNTRDEIPQRTSWQLARRKISPGCRFQWCVRTPGRGGVSSLSPFPCTRPPFSPFFEIKSMASRVSYEAATEDNWILIRFLFPFCSDVNAVLCFLPTVSIYLAFPMTRDEHTAVPGLQCFL